MAKHQSDATWVQINPETLGPKAFGAYNAYKALYRQMKEAREAFEALAAGEAGAPAGKRMVFGYNFGKLSAALVEDDRKVAKPKAGVLSLADFIANQVQAGGRG